MNSLDEVARLCNKIGLELQRGELLSNRKPGRKSNSFESTSSQRYNLRQRDPSRSYESFFSPEKAIKKSTANRQRDQATKWTVEGPSQNRVKSGRRECNSEKCEKRPRLSSISEEKDNGSGSDSEVFLVNTSLKYGESCEKFRGKEQPQKCPLNSCLSYSQSSANYPTKTFANDKQAKVIVGNRNVNYCNKSDMISDNQIISKNLQFNTIHLQNLHVQDSGEKEEILEWHNASKFTFSHQEISDFQVEIDNVDNGKGNGSEIVEEEEPMSPLNGPLYDMPPPSTRAQKEARRCRRKLQLEQWKRNEERRSRSERLSRRQAPYRANTERSTQIHWKSDLIDIYYFNIGNESEGGI